MKRTIDYILGVAVIFLLLFSVVPYTKEYLGYPKFFRDVKVTTIEMHSPTEVRVKGEFWKIAVDGCEVEKGSTVALAQHLGGGSDYLAIRAIRDKDQPTINKAEGFNTFEFVIDTEGLPEPEVAIWLNYICEGNKYPRKFLQLDLSEVK